MKKNHVFLFSFQFITDSFFLKNKKIMKICSLIDFSFNDWFRSLSCSYRKCNLFFNNRSVNSTVQLHYKINEEKKHMSALYCLNSTWKKKHHVNKPRIAEIEINMFVNKKKYLQFTEMCTNSFAPVEHAMSYVHCTFSYISSSSSKWTCSFIFFKTNHALI